MKYLGLASKLEFQERNVAHHHIFVGLEGSVIKVVDVINERYPAETSLSGDDDALNALISSIHSHQQSPLLLESGWAVQILIRQQHDCTGDVH